MEIKWNCSILHWMCAHWYAEHYGGNLYWGYEQIAMSERATVLQYQGLPSKNPVETLPAQTFYHQTFSSITKIHQKWKSESCWSQLSEKINSHGPRTLCNGPETKTEWKSKSVTDQPINGFTGVGSRDASHLEISYLKKVSSPKTYKYKSRF